MAQAIIRNENLDAKATAFQFGLIVAVWLDTQIDNGI
jgi:hypothetical protein